MSAKSSHTSLVALSAKPQLTSSLSTLRQSKFQTVQLDGAVCGSDTHSPCTPEPEPREEVNRFPLQDPAWKTSVPLHSSSVTVLADLATTLPISSHSGSPPSTMTLNSRCQRVRLSSQEISVRASQDAKFASSRPMDVIKCLLTLLRHYMFQFFDNNYHTHNVPIFAFNLFSIAIKIFYFKISSFSIYDIV